MTEITISKSFSTRTNRTDRVMQVAEAFGIGLEDKQFTIFDELKLNIIAGDVVYVTGQSGSGKSVLLREAAEKLGAAGLKVMDMADVEYDDRPIIDQLGSDMGEATRLLALAGISDAYLFIRKPQELSDGQRYRFRLAKMIESDADVWVADEFGAVLDRTTAKVVSFNFQKIARKMGKVLMVATTHQDLVDELAPSLVVRKLFQDRVSLTEGECV